MRGKWVLGAAAILALVVVGGIGGLTMRAFAGTSHYTAKTTTVTKWCLYVDRTDGGDSYGDVSVVPKYGHKTCIVGKRGPAGNSSVVSWNKTVQTPAAPLGAKRKGTGSTAYIVLAKVGPFAIRGYCTGADGSATAETDVFSGQDGSSFSWNGSSLAGSFGNGNDQAASPSASGSSQSPSYDNESDYGDFSVSTADGKTAFTGSANNGVYLNGSTGPACSFSGYLVMEK